jgi:hypothetical protein
MNTQRYKQIIYPFWLHFSSLSSTANWMWHNKKYYIYIYLNRQLTIMFMSFLSFLNKKKTFQHFKTCYNINFNQINESINCFLQCVNIIKIFYYLVCQLMFMNDINFHIPQKYFMLQCYIIISFSFCLARLLQICTILSKHDI